MNQANVYSVGQVNAYIKNMFQQDFLLRRISVKGEVSNCKYHHSGHLYFTLKDQTGAMACVMFAGARRGLAFRMQDGDQVVVTGSLDVYERDGRYQLYAREIVLAGAGLLYERFLALKAELEEMGMFAPEYKQPIPAYVRKLGIVTAPTGAAVRDIQNIAYRRNPYIQLILYPALVQGEGAVESIVTGLRVLDGLGLDAIIVGRGGGSIEDLWAFNEEAVARAIFNCHTPVISAVGHETDVTIADFVADLRAPTPSAGAELAVADVGELLRRIESLSRRLQTAAWGHISDWRAELESWRRRWLYLSPENQIREKRQRLVDLDNRLQEAGQRILTDKRHRLQLLIQRMESLSPLSKLNQGFSYVEDGLGRNVSSVEQVSRDDQIRIRVRDGCMQAKVLEIEKYPEGDEPGEGSVKGRIS